jgi:thymidylate kinase
MVTRRLPLYIALEGIDGAGKSEVAEKLAEILGNLGFRCSVHRFTHLGPGRWGRFMRHLYYPNEPGDWFYLLDSFSLVKVILFWVNARLNLAGTQVDDIDIVIGDRSIFTLYAMFPRCLLLRGLSQHFISLFKFPVPRHVFFLKINPRHAIERMLATRGSLAPNESLAKLKSTQAEYARILELVAQGSCYDGVEVHAVDAQQPLAVVLEEIRMKITTITTMLPRLEGYD